MFGWFNKKKAVDQDAVELFVKMSSGEMSQENADQMLDWAENDPSKLDDMELLSEVWDDTASMELDQSIFFEEQTESNWRDTVVSFFDGWRYPVGAVAAMAMVAFVFIALPSQGPDNGFTSYATVRGGDEKVKLADGSNIHLNGMSRVEVAYSDDERRISMLEGEVYYQVSPDKSRPFIVETSGVEVKALGTAFDIEAGANAVTVIVTEGTVSVGYGDNVYTYSAGNKIEVTHSNAGASFQVTKLLLADFEEAVTWRTGVINFSGEPLSLALERINRQSAKPIILVDEGLSDLQIFGSFRQNNITSFINAIETLYPVRVVESQYRVALYKRSEKEKRAGDSST